MAVNAELDQNVALRNLLNIQENENGSSDSQDAVSQLLAAAMVQFGSTSVEVTATSAGHPQSSGMNSEPLSSQDVLHLGFNPQMAATCTMVGSDVRAFPDINLEKTVEVPTSVKKKPICVKLPIEVRKKIIGMRKDGKKCADVAKELHVSVSGAQKVWERFLATGMVHDRRPSTYAGRPRKYPRTEEVSKASVEPCVAEVGVGKSHSERVESTAATSHESGSAILGCGNSSDVYEEGSLGIPGAMVEIMETDSLPVTPKPTSRKRKRNSVPEYREELLLKLIDGCPLASLRSMAATSGSSVSNPHLANLPASINQPLYMEYLLGHPFGKPPSPRPFEGSSEEASILLTDPANPTGKELLVELGYSTKVYFNACCKPSPLFSLSKVLSKLPFSVGPGHMAETMQAVLQVLLNLCSDPASALDRLPSGSGMLLVVTTASGDIKSQSFPYPTKLSEYWPRVYKYAAALECCENFLSAKKPSAPCLLCHPFESVVKTLKIRDEEEPQSQELLGQDQQSLLLKTRSAVPMDPPEETSPQIQVDVLQSGQVPEGPQTTPTALTTPTTSLTTLAQDSVELLQNEQILNAQNLPTVSLTDDSMEVVQSELVLQDNLDGASIATSFCPVPVGKDVEVGSSAGPAIMETEPLSQQEGEGVPVAHQTSSFPQQEEHNLPLSQQERSSSVAVIVEGLPCDTGDTGTTEVTTAQTFQQEEERSQNYSEDKLTQEPSGETAASATQCPCVEPQNEDAVSDTGTECKYSAVSSTETSPMLATPLSSRELPRQQGHLPNSPMLQGGDAWGTSDNNGQSDSELNDSYCNSVSTHTQLHFSPTRSVTADGESSTTSDVGLGTTTVVESGTITDVGPGTTIYVGPGTTIDVGLGTTIDVGPGTTMDVGPGTTMDVGPGTTKDVGPGTTKDVGPGTTMDVGPGTTMDVGPGTTMDVGPGTTMDVGPGTTMDVGPVTTMDVGPGTTTDVGPGTTMDVGLGINTDIGPGTTTDVGPGTTIDVGPGITTDVGPGTTMDVGLGIITDIGPGTTTDVGPVTTNDVGPGTTMDVGPGTATDVGPGTTTDAGPGTTTDCGSDSTKDVGSGTTMDVGPGTATDVGPGTTTDPGSDPAKDVGPTTVDYGPCTTIDVGSGTTADVGSGAVIDIGFSTVTDVGSGTTTDITLGTMMVIEPGTMIDIEPSTTDIEPDIEPGDIGPGTMTDSEPSTTDIEPDIEPGDIGPGTMTDSEPSTTDIEPGDIGPGTMTEIGLADVKAGTIVIKCGSMTGVELSTTTDVGSNSQRLDATGTTAAATPDTRTGTTAKLACSTTTTTTTTTTGVTGDPPSVDQSHMSMTETPRRGRPLRSDLSDLRATTTRLTDSPVRRSSRRSRGEPVYSEKLLSYKVDGWSLYGSPPFIPSAAKQKRKESASTSSGSGLSNERGVCGGTGLSSGNDMSGGSGRSGGSGTYSESSTSDVSGRSSGTVGMKDTTCDGSGISGRSGMSVGNDMSGRSGKFDESGRSSGSGGTVSVNDTGPDGSGTSGRSTRSGGNGRSSGSDKVGMNDTPDGSGTSGRSTRSGGNGRSSGSGGTVSVNDTGPDGSGTSGRSTRSGGSGRSSGSDKVGMNDTPDGSGTSGRSTRSGGNGTPSGSGSDKVGMNDTPDGSGTSGRSTRSGGNGRSSGSDKVGMNYTPDGSGTSGSTRSGGNGRSSGSDKVSMNDTPDGSGTSGRSTRSGGNGTPSGSGRSSGSDKVGMNDASDGNGTSGRSTRSGGNGTPSGSGRSSGSDKVGINDTPDGSGTSGRSTRSGRSDRSSWSGTPGRSSRSIGSGRSSGHGIFSTSSGHGVSIGSGTSSGPGVSIGSGTSSRPSLSIGSGTPGGPGVSIGSGTPVYRRLDHHPMQWCVDDVESFINGISSDLAEIFKDHEIDGESLLNLDPEMMVNCMNIKTGPAIRIFKHILDLKRSYNMITF